jgi:hypothetical protein
MNSNKLDYLILFLLNPFIGLFALLKDFRRRSISFFFPLFLSFIGASLYPYGDAERYRDRFYEMHDKQISFDNFKNTLLDGETSWDVAVPTISYIIATFTRNEKVLFLVFGLILGFFYGRNIQYILNKLDKRSANYFIIFLVIIFSMMVTFWDGIRGVRMWTAAHIYFYGISRILEKREIKYYPYLILACAYHFSFVLPVLLFLGYFVLPKRNILMISFIFFVLSIFLADANFDFTKNLVLNNSTDFFQAKSEVYTADTFVEKIESSSAEHSFHRALFGLVGKFSIFFLLIISFLENFRTLNYYNHYYRFFLFAFIFSGVANFISVLPSGGRFISVAMMTSIVPIYYGYKNTRKRHIYHLMVFPLSFWLIVTMRTSLYSLSLGSLVGNPFVIYFQFLTDQNLDSLIK